MKRSLILVGLVAMFVFTSCAAHYCPTYSKYSGVKKRSAHKPVVAYR